MQLKCTVIKVGYECFLQDNQSLEPPQPPGKIVTARSIGANVSASSGLYNDEGKLGKECWWTNSYP